jgi:DNA polymerase III alpha subunit
MYWNCHSYYSLRYGTFSIESLVDRAKALGLEALGLTDINNSTGVLDFVKLCRESGIKPMAGIEFRDGDDLLYTCLAMNNEGFREINTFLSHHNLEGTPLPPHPPDQCLGGLSFRIRWAHGAERQRTDRGAAGNGREAFIH